MQLGVKNNVGRNCAWKCESLDRGKTMDRHTADTGYHKVIDIQNLITGKRPLKAFIKIFALTVQ